MANADLRTIWTVLETEVHKVVTDSIEVASTNVTVHGSSVLAGMDSNGRRYLLVPILPGESFAEAKRIKAVNLIRLEHNGRSYIAAVCLDPESEDIFELFAAGLLARVSESDKPAQVTINELNRWRRLFSESTSSTILGENQRIGLLGELLTLEALVANDPHRRVNTWIGPQGGRHDLSIGNYSLEVKATLSREGRFVGIHGIEQLEPPEGGFLYLIHYRLESSASGQCIPGVIDRIIDMGVDPVEIYENLALVGYTIKTQKLYRNYTYRVIDRRAYDVTSPEFPRLSPGSFVGGAVPAGLLRIAYTVDLTGEPPYPLTDQDLDKVLSAMGLER